MGNVPHGTQRMWRRLASRGGLQWIIKTKLGVLSEPHAIDGYAFDFRWGHRFRNLGSDRGASARWFSA